jgi:hypothetical protein
VLHARIWEQEGQPLRAPPLVAALEASAGSTVMVDLMSEPLQLAGLVVCACGGHQNDPACACLHAVLPLCLPFLCDPLADPMQPALEGGG